MPIRVQRWGGSSLCILVLELVVGEVLLLLLTVLLLLELLELQLLVQ